MFIGKIAAIVRRYIQFGIVESHNRRHTQNIRRQPSLISESLERRTLLSATNDEAQTDEDTEIDIAVLGNDPGAVNVVPDSIVVADYVDDFRTGSPAEGWQYLWNQNGPFGDVANYSEMTWHSWRYHPHTGGDDNLSSVYLGATFGHPGHGVDDAAASGIDRYAIAAFTVTEGGEYAISNSQLNRTGEFGDGVDVSIHTTGNAVTQLLQVSPENAATGTLEGAGTFDTNLGLLNAGDTVYVAVGPDGLANGSTNGNDGFGWDFSIVRTDVIGRSTKGAIVETDGTTVTYDPEDVFDFLRAGESETDTFTYSSTDGTETTSATVTVTVDGVNDAPTAVDDESTAYRNRLQRLFVLSNDSDVDSPSFSLVAFTQPSHGSLVDNGDGSLIYVPALNYVGPDSFTYTIEDPDNLQAAATVTLDVQAVEAVAVNLDAGTRRFIEGTNDFDRARFVNTHGDLWVTPELRSQLADPDEFGVIKTRYDTTIDSTAGGVHLATNYPDGLPEDPLRPGFIDPVLLAAAMDAYNNWIATGARHQPLREYPASGNQNVAVFSGRNTTLHWPDYLLTDPETQQFKENIPLNYPGYADLINEFFAQLVVPISPDRLYFEVINEPNFDLDAEYTIDNVVDIHQAVPPLVRAQHPDLLIGGPSFGGTGFRDQEGWDLFNQVLTQAGDQLDFWSFHPYDRYNISASNVVNKGIVTSAGRLTANLDLIESRSNELFGSPKQFAITEYGAWTLAFGDYSQYDRQQRMWDQVNAVVEKMLVFMDRPDRILTATPFINTIDGGVDGGASVGDAWSTRLWARDDDGTFVETTVASMYRLLSGVDGAYASVSSDNADLQTQAFRDGNTVYLVLNNLTDKPLDVDLTATTGSYSGIVSAVRKRLRYDNGTADFDSGTAITNWNQVPLDGQEKTVIQFTLDGFEAYDAAINERTFYGAASNIPIASGGQASTTVTADLTEAVSAAVRIGFMRPGDTSVPEITISVNGTDFTLPAGTQGYDDADATTTSREVSIPLSALNNGSNTVTVSFPDDGGHLLSTVILVKQSVGDFNDSGQLDYDDRELLVDTLGESVDATNVEFDLNEDGVINQADVDFWNQLRGDFTDLVSSEFFAIDTNIQLGKTDVQFIVENRGTVDAAAFGTHVVWSANAIIGDADDIVVANSAATFAGLAAATSATRTVSLQLDRAALFADALATTPAGQQTGEVPVDISHLFLVVDSNGVIAEADESNNFGQGRFIDSDLVTYFPWDTNRNRTVEPLEALDAIRAIGTADNVHDFDGDGFVTPLEALSSLQRIGYVRPIGSAKTSAASLAKLQPVFADRRSVRKSPVTASALGSEHFAAASLKKEETPALFPTPANDERQQNSPVVSDLPTIDEHFRQKTRWLDVV